MANNPLNTELLDRAIVFAVRAHAGTERRGKGFPYIVHPLEAVEIVATHEKNDSVDNWRARKQLALDRLKRASRDAKIVTLGDKLSNMRAIARDYAEQGDQLWNLFHAKNSKDHEWRYRGLAEALRELQDTFAYKEFEQLINNVFSPNSVAL